jgi:hypothetical protein
VIARYFCTLADNFPHRIFMGKNSVAQISLGKTSEDEYKDNLRNVSKVNEYLDDDGICGLST